MDEFTEKFVVIARDYIAWAEAKPRAGTDELRTAISFVARLYSAALTLEDVELDSDHDEKGISHEQWKEIYERFEAMPFNRYWVMFYPTNLLEEESIAGHLADDLADIYRDLVAGLKLYENGYNDEAVWHWKFHFNIHWGRHATEALYAMHSFATDNDIEL